MVIWVVLSRLHVSHQHLLSTNHVRDTAYHTLFFPKQTLRRRLGGKWFVCIKQGMGKVRQKRDNKAKKWRCDYGLTESSWGSDPLRTLRSHLIRGPIKDGDAEVFNPPAHVPHGLRVAPGASHLQHFRAAHTLAEMDPGASEKFPGQGSKGPGPLKRQVSVWMGAPFCSCKCALQWRRAMEQGDQRFWSMEGPRRLCMSTRNGLQTLGTCTATMWAHPQDSSIRLGIPNQTPVLNTGNSFHDPPSLGDSPLLAAMNSTRDSTDSRWAHTCTKPHWACRQEAMPLFCSLKGPTVWRAKWSQHSPGYEHSLEFLGLHLKTCFLRNENKQQFLESPPLDPKLVTEHPTAHLKSPTHRQGVSWTKRMKISPLMLVIHSSTSKNPKLSKPRLNWPGTQWGRARPPPLPFPRGAHSQPDRYTSLPCFCSHLGYHHQSTCSFIYSLTQPTIYWVLVMGQMLHLVPAVQIWMRYGPR